MNPKIISYLRAYNLISLTGWLVLLVYLGLSCFSINQYSIFGLALIQGIAVLEIFHAHKKWVNSAPLMAFAQIFARLFIVVLIYVLWKSGSSFLLTGITAAVWSIADITRYGFYFFKNPTLSKIFQFLRYNAFIVLYPTGVVLEFIIGFNFLKLYQYQITIPVVLTAVVFLSYFYYFPRLYRYMWLQRAKRKNI